MRIHLILLSIFFASSCMTRAPSDYELDRRAGLIPTPDLDKIESQVGPITQTDASPITPQIPQRESSRIEKILVFAQPLDEEFWLQSTYVYFEITPSKWARFAAEGK